MGKVGPALGQESEATIVPAVVRAVAPAERRSSGGPFDPGGPVPDLRGWGQRRITNEVSSGQLIALTLPLVAVQRA
jgi:hypothetical protein